MQLSIPTVRLDKWLWAARFFKTRSLATEAVNGGKVHLFGKRVKPSRALKTGDELRIQRGELAWSVVVLALAEKRGSASIAQTLYAETEQSLAQRKAAESARRDYFIQNPAPPKHPDKQARRKIIRFTRKQSTD